MNGRLLIFFVVTLILCFSACKNRKLIEVQHVVDEWIGKTIKFPENPKCYVFGKDTIANMCGDLYRKEYKILLYVDSTGCNSCRLRLFEWKQLIAEADTLFRGQIGFILFFQPKSLSDVALLFKQTDFRYPVFIDMDNTINKLNNFPAHYLYQCFLLDRNNQILRIGNPVMNLKVWELYKQVILENNNNNK
jgi:hypothetical protein